MSRIEQALLNITVAEKHFFTDNGTIDGSSDNKILTLNLIVSKISKSPQTVLAIGQVSVNMTVGEFTRGKSIFVNVTQGIKEWFDLHREDLSLIIRTQVAETGKNVLIPDPTTEDISNPPFLDLHILPPQQRKKRNIGMECGENSDETRCCRFPVTVDFEKFGWDWIIAPKTYEAYYCAGECPFSFMEKHSHTHIAHLKGHQPCCSPSKVSPISLLYFENDSQINLVKIPSMVVESCGCS